MTKNALWIEDHPETVASLAAELSSGLGIKISYAVTASAALRRLRDGHFDVIFVDNFLPVGSLIILREEFGLEFSNETEVGAEIAKGILEGSWNFQSSTPSAVVFISGVSAPDWLRCVQSNVPFIEWPKNIQTSTTAYLEALIQALKNKRSRSVFVPAKNTNKQPNVGKFRREEQVIELSLLRMHIHESLHFERIATENLLALEQRLTLLTGVRKSIETDVLEVIRQTIDEVERAYDTCIDTSKGADSSRLDEINSLLNQLKECLRTPSNGLGKEHAIAGLGSIVELAGERFVSLHLVAKEAHQKAILADVASISASVRSRLVSLTEHNLTFLNKNGHFASNLEAEKFSALDEVESALAQYELRAKNSRCVLRRYFPSETDGRLPICGIKHEFSTILGNILDNAIKHSFQMHNHQSWIDVKVNLVAKDVIISIENWGSEIAHTDAVYSGRRGQHSLASGMGQGLLISKELCKKNGWKLRHTSLPANKSNRLTLIQNQAAFINTFFVSAIRT